jgi:hypothetical protein
MNREDVFTPYSYPKHTYVQRGDKELEQRLERELNLSSRVVSLSGPSKSGKTVLVQRVVSDPEGLIMIPGAKIEKMDDVGEHILDELGIPDSVETRRMANEQLSEKIEGSVKGLLGFISSSIKGGMTQSKITETSRVKTHDRNGISQAIDEIKNRDIVLFIDDFHYIERDVQRRIAEVIKDAINQGLTICTALVPHRGDDLQRANSDLRGRVWSLEIDYWEKEDLKKIADKGFSKLKIDFPEAAKEKFAEEAAGSPQLIQQMCLEACRLKGIRLRRKSVEKIEFDKEDIESTLSRVVDATNHQSTVEILDNGPKTRGKERNEYNFHDGKSGDVYRCILRAIRRNSSLSIHYDKLNELIDQECAGSSPTGSSIISSCEKMDELLKSEFPDERYLEWDSTKEVLSIPDPYLLFYLRWSNWESRLDRDL